MEPIRGKATAKLVGQDIPVAGELRHVLAIGGYIPNASTYTNTERASIAERHKQGVVQVVVVGGQDEGLYVAYNAATGEKLMGGQKSLYADAADFAAYAAAVMGGEYTD